MMTKEEFRQHLILSVTKGILSNSSETQGLYNMSRINGTDPFMSAAKLILGLTNSIMKLEYPDE